MLDGNWLLKLWSNTVPMLISSETVLAPIEQPLSNTTKHCPNMTHNVVWMFEQMLAPLDKPSRNTTPQHLNNVQKMLGE